MSRRRSPFSECRERHFTNPLDTVKTSRALVAVNCSIHSCGEMSEWLKGHAWKAIPARHVVPDRDTRSASQSEGYVSLLLVGVNRAAAVFPRALDPTLHNLYTVLMIAYGRPIGEFPATLWLVLASVCLGTLNHGSIC